ncbi:MC153.1 [Molluscum contagiosum virus subtype 2]|uniref:MC153.1 n=2 Tax=Molluscum contagiosum virus TaxID=10279 RepID=A0A1S7DMH4_MCV2|nr:MC153.1 [Molluscum contagiosum virus subtype 2]QHW16543.1 MC153.1R [Molluscum contagiosum virus]AYO87789.1 MC153.1 [Molluscum contagiosum virus subtype 2]AYO87959.1 MC153.1 [Molluscum contagiosum virus subtype 2]AYO88129.1 MC153.1 [Molluscum contagiosum virus subtype 2]
MRTMGTAVTGNNVTREEGRSGDFLRVSRTEATLFVVLTLFGFVLLLAFLVYLLAVSLSQ